MDRARISSSLALVGVLCLAPTARPSEAPHAADDARHAAKVELGRRLFFDPAASRLGATPCSSCHDPERGFADPRTVSQDETGLTARHSQGLLDIGERPTAGFHWDAEFATVADLVIARLGTPDERRESALERFKSMATATMESGADIDRDAVTRALPSVVSGGGYGPTTPGATPSGPITPRPVTRGTRGAVSVARPRNFRARGFVGPPTAPDRTVSHRLAANGLYGQGFKRAFGSVAASTERVAEAIEAYVLSLRSTEAPFDRYLAGDETALSPPAARGFELFAGKAGCNSCHTVPVPGSGRALTDGAFHNTGVAFRERAEGQLERENDVGMRRIDFRMDSTGKFKTPNLRDVAERGPYMHDGSFETLADVVDYYAVGGTPNDHLDGAVKPLDLSQEERADLVAFLESLSGDTRPGLGELPDHRADETVVFLRDEEGDPLAGKSVTVRPAGDRLRGAETMPDALVARTDPAGRVRFAFPASTHVSLHVQGYEIHGGGLLPDFTRAARVFAIPDDLVVIEVSEASGGKRLPGLLEVMATRDEKPVTFRRRYRDGDHSALYVANATDAARVTRVRSRVTIRDRDVGLVRLDPSRKLMASIDLRDTDALRGRSTRLDTGAIRDAMKVIGPLLVAAGEIETR